MDYFTTEMTDLSLTLMGDDVFTGMSGPINTAIDKSRFSDSEQRKIELIVEEEGVCPEAEWLVWSKCRGLIHPLQKDECIVWENKLYHFDENGITYLEEWLDWEPDYIEEAINQDHRGLDYYDTEWSKDKTREVVGIEIEDKTMYIYLKSECTDLACEPGDTVYLEPWVMVNGFSVKDFTSQEVSSTGVLQNAYITVSCDQFEDFDKSELDAVANLLTETVETITVYRRNKHKNIDFRDSYYDGAELEIEAA